MHFFRIIEIHCYVDHNTCLNGFLPLAFWRIHIKQSINQVHQIAFYSNATLLLLFVMKNLIQKFSYHILKLF